ncbi:uncharacterized protein LOC106167226 [Lingula anatina]|uniref:Uncharacterized protein LOC106167226 n=1 Tax=Lingula anatina TaxID=7574 RepID=A0A1S3IT65_LINAN|nr:uncharacterized protein LOC106167226 [Lingula anatina]|eukprot:XP_013401400.1 uncharacterized protein LOC106167226 [Lingula anatina]
MAALLTNFYFLVVWVIFSTVYLCMCCTEGDGHFGWQCDTVTGCFCKQGQRCQQTLGTCPEHCVDNPWGIGCHDEHGNLAYGKPASQSNTNFSYTDDEWFSATLAVDGNNSTADSNCTRTHHQPNTYWTVDLEGLSVIREVTVIKPAAICPQNNEKLCIKNDTSNHVNCISSTNAQCFGGVLRYNISPPILARHVTILKTGQQTLRLCEVIVRGYTYPYNVAFGKRAEQINVINEGDPGRAIDGKTTAYYLLESCTHTNDTLDPWWEVDLGQQYVVYSVTLLNRDENVHGGE